LPERLYPPTAKEAARPTGRPLTPDARRLQQKQRQQAMFKQPKMRQASLIVFATTVILILPNLTRLVS
jgi:hypothetical protein